ncbi:AAA family ATPase [Candidatus Parabeggiatoa sp. HSG14]|uniref:AAA family ATPase n=1 Tax=Candidatus Parabeggiatoa sp. HSG14 TaxID=3055593 RepID=UPI0025A6CCA1|nr:AAA family ATPase [Thiotrichales bacterium HSG14]
MFIRKLQLNNFKRFTDLTIDLSNQTLSPKLVLIIGINGSGKSGIFDAFEAISSQAKDDTMLQSNYYRKNVQFDFEVKIELVDKTLIIRHDNKKCSDNLSPTAFYGRSSLRQVPQLTRTTLGQEKSVNFEKDSDRPKMYIERDSRFENDLDKITELILKDFYRSDQAASQIRLKYLNPISEAFKRIFGENSATQLTLLELIPPLDDKVAHITFKKGESEIHYNYLGNGEKEVFNILVDLLVRKNLYQDTIYYFDELDLHLNTKLQYRLLKEIVENWIPANCQLWTASHSLGFIEYANEVENAVIIDFDELDFDKPQTLFVQPKNRYDVFEIAVSKEFLSHVLEGKTIVFSENTDTPFYNRIGIKDTIFFTGIDKNDVFFKAKNWHYYGLIDRDFLTDEEIQSICHIYPNLLILNYYSIENYFYHPDNLAEYYQSKQQDFDKITYINKLSECKARVKDEIIFGILGARKGYPFFKENQHAKLRKQFTENKTILSLLQSDDFETFYKVFSAKDYARNLPERQNLNKEQLSQTNWFKTQIQSIFLI